MASSALEVLSLEDARLQCRADDGPEHDALLRDAVEDAVGYVSRMTGIPLVDRSENFNVVPSGKTPIEISARDVKEVEEIRYWQPTQELRESPTGTVTVSDLGRIEELRNGCTRIWYPAAGWPNYLPGSCFQVTVKVGFDITEKSKSLRRAVILMTRTFFENPDRFESDFAVVALIEPWKRYG